MSTMAKKIELKGWPGYPGGLDVVHGQTGKYAYFTKFRDFDIMFHVSTCLPHVSGDDQQLEKKRHIGNDVVVIVFQDGDTPIAPASIKSYFNHVFIIVHPIRPEETPKSDTPPSESSPGHRERGSSTDSHHERIPSDNSSQGDHDHHSVHTVADEFGRLDVHGRGGDSLPPHSPSSPSLLQRLGTERSGSSPSRRSPIFVRTPRSNDDSPAGSPPRGEFAVPGQRSSSAVLSGTSPSARGLHSVHERSSTPSRVPHLRYNVDSRAQSAIVGQQSFSLREGVAGREESSPFNRRVLDDADRSSNASSSGAMRSPRIHDGATEDDQTSLPSDEESFIFMDPVSAAAMPSGGTLPASWLVDHVAATPRESSLPRLHMDGRSASVDLGQHSPTGLRIRSDSSFTDDRRVSVGGAGSTAGFDSDTTPRSFGPDSDDAHSFPHPSSGPAPISQSNPSHSNSAIFSSSSTGTEDSILAPSAPTAPATEGRRSRAGSGKLEDSGKTDATKPDAKETGSEREAILRFADSIGIIEEEDEGEDDKKRRLSRRMSLGSSKQLIKSSKSGKLVKAMPQITRAKMNVAAKNPPVQYRIEVVCKDGVIPCDPKLPGSPIFNAGPYLREFLLTKLINAERAAYYSKHFSKPIERTRELLLQDMVNQNK